LSELEQAEAAVVAAVQKAEIAREEAEKARQAAQLRQEERQRQWADREVAANVDRIREHAKAVGAARTTFEGAVVDDPTQAIKTFVSWTAALADQHAAGGSYDLAMSILGRTARLNEWPRLSFTSEVDTILERYAGEQLTAATETERERRRIAFDGEGTK
jgi:hypothetical protein